MDTGEGRMEMLENLEAEILKNNPEKTRHIFSVDEVVNVKGSRFRITKITPKEMTLRILPWEEE